MLELVVDSSGKYHARHAIVYFGQKELEFLCGELDAKALNRVRIQAHRAEGDRLHESFTAYLGKSYIRPRKDMHSDTSLFVLRGEVDMVFIGDEGTIERVELMGEIESGKAYYCRIPQARFYTFIIRSEAAVLFEAGHGPCNINYADWAPSESSLLEGNRFVEKLNSNIHSAVGTGLRGSIGLQTQSPQVLIATDSIVTFSQVENTRLEQQRGQDNLDRLRICAHPTSADSFHEMLMSFSGETYIRPASHADKDESLLLLEGLTSCLFFDETGAIVSAVRLGPIGTGRSQYCRVPANMLHSLIIESPTVLIKETTTGPFEPSQTYFPSWAPPTSDGHAVDECVRSMRAWLESH